MTKTNKTKKAIEPCINSTKIVNGTKHKCRWEYFEWSQCSKKCGGGFKTSHPSCVRIGFGKVSLSFCKGQKPEEKIMLCNEQACKYRWRSGLWGACTGCLGHSGFKSRMVECVKESNKYGGDDLLEDDAKCEDVKPSSKQLCCSNQPCRKRRGQKNKIDVLIGSLFKQINNEGIKKNKKRFILSKTKNGKNTRNKSNHEGMYFSQSERYQNNNYGKKFHKNIKYAITKTPLGTRGSASKNNTVSVNGHLWESHRVQKDFIPSNDIRLIEVPLIEEPEDIDLPEEMEEKVGNEIVDVLDFCHKKTFRGEKAINEWKHIKERTEIPDDDETIAPTTSTSTTVKDTKKTTIK